MKPSDAKRPIQLGLREFLWFSGAILLAGCTSPAVRSQSPEDLQLASIEKQVRLIETVAVPYGMTYVKGEAPALVVGLMNTGADPPPSAAGPSCWPTCRPAMSRIQISSWHRRHPR